MFAEAAFGKQVREELVSDTFLAREFVRAERESLREGETSAFKPLGVVTETYLAEGVSPQTACKPTPVPYV